MINQQHLSLKTYKTVKCISIVPASVNNDVTGIWMGDLWMFMSFQVKLVDRKYVSRKVRLTETTSNTLQKYLKMTLRQNVSNLYGMDKNSWCLYWADKNSGKRICKPKLSLSWAIKSELIIILQSLSDNKLLEKCKRCR